MKTIYLPDTYVDPRWAEQMAAVWGRLTLLQPSVDTCLPDMEALQEAGVVEMVFPASDAQDALKDVFQGLKQWAAQYTGGDLAAMVEHGKAIPFFNSQSSAQIVAEIRKGGKTPAADPAADFRENVFQAQLFLAMAQEFDLQQAVLTRDIAALSAKENEMMATLKGEALVDTAPPIASSRDARVAPLDPGMIARRLKAWARVMAVVEGMETRSGNGTEVLFLTTGRAVLAQIQDIFPEAETRLPGVRLASGDTPGGNIEHLPAWLAGPLTAGSGDAADADGNRLPGVDLIEIPRISVAAFLLRLSGQTSREESERVSQALTGSCWVGCMTRLDDGT